MDDLTLRCYDTEMRYLLEAGEEFARAHPEQAAMLSLDKAGAHDPFIEHLSEGFAFLMGRICEKPDNDLPELTEGVVSLLQPHYLHTIPSMSVVEFTPGQPEVKEPTMMIKGFKVLSRPIDEEGTRYRYTTTKAIALQSLSLEHARLATDTDDRSMITLRFTCSQLTDWSRVGLSHIPLYCSADAPLACTMYEVFTLNTARMWLRMSDEVGRRPLNGYFSAPGFGREDSLWPEDGRNFRGYQLLLEYFTFREKFMFIDLRGLETVALPAGLAWFKIDVVLAERWEYDFCFSEKQLHLHCVPVINLFPLESDPLTINSLQTEHPPRPVYIQDGHIEIYTVDSVISSHQQVYVPFSSFRRRSGMVRRDAADYYYHTRVRRGPSGLYNTWLTVDGEAFDDHTVPEDRSLSLTLTGASGQLLYRALQNTVLDAVMRTTSVSVAVRDLCTPTLSCCPPTQDRFRWRVLSHLDSSFLSLMDNTEVPHSTLALYEWTDSEMNRRRLEAILDVNHRTTEHSAQDRLVCGVRIEVTPDSYSFTGRGDICLFGRMLSRLFALCTDICLFNRLIIILQPTGERLEWEERHSQRIPG